MAERIIALRPEFDGNLVNWGGPDEPRTEVCCYCGDELDEASIPLVFWNAEGWCPEFCDHCQATYWGIQGLDDPVEPVHEPEVLQRKGLLLPRDHPDAPKYWMNETTGVVAPAVQAYLFNELMAPEYIPATRAYLRRWICSPVWRGPKVDFLRGCLDELTSRTAIDRWIAIAVDEWLAPF
jgi:hypothetical protein